MLILCRSCVCVCVCVCARARAEVRSSIDKEAAVFGTARPQISSLWGFVSSGYSVASVFESEAAQEVWRWGGGAWLSLCILQPLL